MLDVSKTHLYASEVIFIVFSLNFCVYFFSLIPLSKVRTEILNSISLLTAEWGWSALNDCKNWLPFTFYNLPMLFALQIANFYLFIVNFLIKSYHKCPNQEATAKLTQKYEKKSTFHCAATCWRLPKIPSRPSTLTKTTE